LSLPFYTEVASEVALRGAGVCRDECQQLLAARQAAFYSFLAWRSWRGALGLFMPLHSIHSAGWGGKFP